MQTLTSRLPARIFCRDALVETDSVGCHAACSLCNILHQPNGIRVCRRVLSGCGPGRLGQLEGLSLGVSGLREYHHRGQAASSTIADGAFRAHLRFELLCHPPAGSADGGGHHLPALCHRASLLRQLGGHCHRLHFHAHSGSRAYVPLQQPRCLAGAIDDRCHSRASQIPGVCQPSFWQLKAHLVDGSVRCSDWIRLPCQATAGAARTARFCSGFSSGLANRHCSSHPGFTCCHWFHDRRRRLVGAADGHRASQRQTLYRWLPAKFLP